jgi:hypothetical protein
MAAPTQPPVVVCRYCGGPRAESGALFRCDCDLPPMFTARRPRWPGATNR